VLYRAVADLTVVVHFGFILFVIAGAFLALRWPRIVWLHIPAVAWGALIELRSLICPLTPLENHFRRLGGEAGYEGGYIEHYLIPIIYPGNLTRGAQLALGLAVVAINVIAYALLWRSVRHGRMRRNRPDMHE